MTVSEPVTLAEIAKRAGVHISTVSRALAGSSGVGRATVTRIRAIADELGYRPDPAAATLRTRRSGALGIIVPRLTDYVLARIYEGADEAAHDLGFTTLVGNSNDDPGLRLERMEKMLARRVEGFLVGDARLDGDDLISALQRRRVPYVLVNRRLRGHPSVTTDDVHGGRLAGEHLLALGHREVGVVAGPTYVSTCVERTHGFVERFLSAGVPVPDSRIEPSTPDAEGGHAAADRLLTRYPDITALFAINDFAAIGAIGAAREHGRTVGQDIAVVGYNDIPLDAWLPVPMTSVRSPMLEMGRAGAQALHRILAGETVEPILLEPTLSVRDSTVRVTTG